MNLTFSGTPLAVINRSNQIWLSSKDIANALGYAKTNAITKMYNQNQDEFTQGMTDIVEVPTLGTSGNLRVRSRIFSLRGAHLIAMFARTPIAKEFRRWVLDILDKEINNSEQAKPTTPAHYRILLTMEGAKVIDSVLVPADSMLLHPDDAIELAKRAGNVLLPYQELRRMGSEQIMALCDEAAKRKAKWDLIYAS